MPAILPPPPEITLSVLLDRYAAILLDAYGVLVSLDGALPGAAACVDELNRRGKPYWILSNTAARLPEHAAERYRGFGLDIPAERLLTSGMLLKPYFSRHGLTGRRVLVLGPDDSFLYVERAGGVAVGPGEDFDAVVLADQAGFPFLDTLDVLVSSLIDKIEAGVEVPLILPNPDLIYPKREGYGLTAGAVAAMLEDVLRQRRPDRPGLGFVRLGKPHPALFAEAMLRSGTRNMVMVGDQVDTDIRGAADFGIDSALLLGGVGSRHALARGPRPTYLLVSLNVQ